MAASQPPVEDAVAPVSIASRSKKLMLNSIQGSQFLDSDGSYA